MSRKVTRFASLSAMADAVKRLPMVGHERANDWNGGGLPRAFQLVERGWPEGTKRAAEMAQRIANRVIAVPGRSIEPQYAYDVTGATFDVGAINQGIPEAWALIQPIETKKEVRITVNVLCSSGIGPETIEARGIAAMAIAMALQAQGYAITIDVCQEAVPSGSYEEEFVYTRLADASTGSPLDLDRIVYALAHPSCSRGLFPAIYGSQQGSIHHRWGQARILDTRDEDANLYLGSAHLRQAERWEDGGEAWVIAEFIRQTQEAH